MARKTSAALVALTLLAAACGSNDSGSDTAAKDDSNLIQKDLLTTTSQGGAGATTSVTAAVVKEPTSMEEWEALWKKERDATVKRIKDNKWGLQPDGKTVLGPEGFKVDLSKCASGWNNIEDLTDTEIKLGSTAPASGTQATAVFINQAMSVFFDYYAAKGMFKDVNGKNRKVNQIIKDDGYDPARTIPLLDELMDSERVFAVMLQGSPSILKTYDKVNQKCIPMLFSSSGHPAWGDPINHPWTNGMLLAYNIEALLWGKFIDDHISEFPAGAVTVAALVMNNDFGRVYDQAFKAYLTTSPNKDRIKYVTELIEPQAATITDSMTTLASKSPNIFIGMLTGTPCAQSAMEAAQNGMNQKVKYRFMPSVCKSNAFVGKAAVGDAGNGWWVIGGGFREIAAPSEDNNPYAKWAREVLTAKGYDYKASAYFAWGLGFGWSWAQAYVVAGQLDGGLTRANMIIAARSLDMTPASHLWGIKANLNGNKDGYWIEGSEIAKYETATGSWVVQGDIIELSGKSRLCAWNQSKSVCE